MRLNSRMPVLAIVVAALLAGCASPLSLFGEQGTRYRHVYKLSSPIRSSKLFFRDDSIRIWFKIDEGAVRFKLKNASSQPMEIDWSQASLGIRNKQYSVRNRSTYYADTPQTAQSRSIPPQRSVVDLAIPQQNVKKKGKGWVEVKLFPTRDYGREALKKRIERVKGSSLSFRLPLRIGGAPHLYEFTFVVDRVEPVPPDTYRRPWRPAPPGRQVSFSTTQQLVVPAVIATVMIGTSVYFITKEKSPPSE